MPKKSSKSRKRSREARRHKRTRRRRSSSSNNRSSSSASDNSSERGSGKGEPSKKNKKRKEKRKAKKRKSNSGDSSDSSTKARAAESDSDSSGDDLSGLSPEQIVIGIRTWKLLEKAWPYEQRPRLLKKKNVVYGMTLSELLAYKKETVSVEDKKNLGEEVFARDCKPEKIRYKAQTDDGVLRLHPARSNRQPLSHPKNWYKTVPKKREVIIRNFPMDHLGLTGHIQETTIGKMHNRCVKLTLDMFCKSSNREARGPHRAGKYPDAHQLREGVGNFCLALHSLWPTDYTGVVILKVLNEARWAENASADDKRRAELITEFFNGVMSDNCGKAVHDMYPLVYEQVMTNI